MNNSLIKTLKSLKGNPRACVYTEPLWGLSMALCFPYASVYMLALGLQDSQIGLIASVYILSQALWAFLSGPITDKLGRKVATAIFDFIAWSIPCIIWWRAEGFWFFFVAAVLNGTMQVTTNSWECLLIEDAEQEQITGINSLVVICGQLSVLFAPISAILFSRLTLVPAIRILYINAFIVMTLKIIILYFYSTETKMGKIRMEESRKKSIINLAGGYGKVLKDILKSKATIFAIAITALVSIVGMINVTFWQVIVSMRLLVPDYFLPFFPIIKSIVTIVFIFLVAPHLSVNSLKKPLLSGFFLYIAGQTLLIFAPVDGGISKYLVLCISLVLDGFAHAYLFMLSRSLLALYVNPEERARVYAISSMVIMTIKAPFGWIAGLLSEQSRILPFVLNIFFLLTGIIVTFFIYSKISSVKENGKVNESE